MAYDIIGNVVDSADKELKDVVVSDGVQNVKTNNDGYYEIKTDKTRLTFSKNGFVTGSFDLAKYKNPSSVNVDITLQTTQAQGQPKEKNFKKTAMYVGVAIVVLVGGYFVYRKFKK
jgi:hypothetical protein